MLIRTIINILITLIGTIINILIMLIGTIISILGTMHNKHVINIMLLTIIRITTLIKIIKSTTRNSKKIIEFNIGIRLIKNNDRNHYKNNKNSFHQKVKISNKNASNAKSSLNKTNKTQISMHLSNKNNDYDPHDNAMFHEGAQKIINRERDNVQCSPNTIVNNRNNNGIGTTTNRLISRNVSTNSPASYNKGRYNTNSALNADNTSVNTNNNNKINKNSDSTNADTTTTTANVHNLTNNTNSNVNNLDNVNTINIIFRAFTNRNGVIAGTT